MGSDSTFSELDRAQHFGGGNPRRSEPNEQRIAGRKFARRRGAARCRFRSRTSCRQRGARAAAKYSCT